MIPPSKNTAHADFIHAAFWMCGAVFAFSAMAIAGRAVMQELDTFELMMYRSFTGVVIVCGYVLWSKRYTEITWRAFPQQLIRNLFHFTGQNLWFAALVLIPIAKVFAIEFTSPVWVLLLAPFILGENLTRSRALTALAGFVGILIVTRPTFGNLSLGEGLAALAAICFAVTSLLTRRLTRTQSITAIMFYLTVTQSVFGVVMAGYDGEIALPSPPLIPAVIAVGLMGLMAHLCLTRALSLAPAASIMPIDFARLPVIAILGFFLFNETVDIYVWIGAIIIFGANYLNLVHESRISREAQI
ncbi:DMT family transporter [Falsihalocynthiibacter arcticus]|uniref:Multidrug DMT transporter permease n=1 Tax=Falsihalocynthiibacter arcticus TaxID=1579316 RepID=A0A126V353_9RHOB|nr:DMT family transporter [Falsihalocynthiibacter arcticus]AML52720.1 multidrug DMT transporter permease [Falsihalocynthiibacter arcticus]